MKTALIALTAAIVSTSAASAMTTVDLSDSSAFTARDRVEQGYTGLTATQGAEIKVPETAVSARYRAQTPGQGAEAYVFDQFQLNDNSPR